jgi:hypothetical protein
MIIDNVLGRRKRRSPADIQRHTRKCRICCHPDRAAIEDDFLHWRNPHEIVNEYKLLHYSAIYRHARALGHTARRNENIRCVLDMLVEKASEASITGNTILRAMRAYSCLTDDGRWIDLPIHVVHESSGDTPVSAAKSGAASSHAAHNISSPDAPRSDADSEPKIPGILIANERLESGSRR